MKMRFTKNKWSFILCMVLIVAMALTTGCGKKDTGADAGQASSQSQTESGSTEADVKVLGEGATVFYVTVTDKDDNETKFEIHTDEEMVGAALLEHGLIAGEESAYGLFIKEVNGITADYDVDGTYWAFYIDGEYAMSGADTTPVTAGSTYAFKVEK